MWFRKSRVQGCGVSTAVKALAIATKILRLITPLHGCSIYLTSLESIAMEPIFRWGVYNGYFNFWPIAAVATEIISKVISLTTISQQLLFKQYICKLYVVIMKHYTFCIYRYNWQDSCWRCSSDWNQQRSNVVSATLWYSPVNI